MGEACARGRFLPGPFLAGAVRSGRGLERGDLRARLGLDGRAGGRVRRLAGLNQPLPAPHISDQHCVLLCYLGRNSAELADGESCPLCRSPALCLARARRPSPCEHGPDCTCVTLRPGAPFLTLCSGTRATWRSSSTGLASGLRSPRRA